MQGWSQQHIDNVLDALRSSSSDALRRTPSPEEFETTLLEKLADLEGVELIRDDIIVMGFGETQEQAVCSHDENPAILLNSRKMELRNPVVKFTWHVIGKEGLKPDPAKVKAVEEMPQPSRKQEVLSLLGFVNYLSRFLPRLTDVAQPLRDLTSKDAKFTWAKQHDTAFNEVKKLVAQVVWLQRRSHPLISYKRKRIGRSPSSERSTVRSLHQKHPPTERRTLK